MDRGEGTEGHKFSQLQGEQLVGFIEGNYESYIEGFKELSIATMGGEAILPTRRVISEDDGPVIHGLNVEPIDEKYLIAENDWGNLSEVPIEVLMDFIVHSTTLLQAMTTKDNRLLWKYTCDTFDDFIRTIQGGDKAEKGTLEYSIWGEIRLVFDIALASNQHQPIMRREKPSYETRMFNKLRTVGAYISYPILEGMLKLLCRNVIKRNGIVREEGKIEKQSSDGQYYTKGDRCSSLLDLLVYFEEEVASEELTSDLESIREKISVFGSAEPSYVYGMIYDWRNTTVHGQMKADLQHSIILNIICLLLWEQVL
jgi:hypothetical protein